MDDTATQIIAWSRFVVCGVGRRVVINEKERALCFFGGVHDPRTTVSVNLDPSPPDEGEGIIYKNTNEMAILVKIAEHKK